MIITDLFRCLNVRVCTSSHIQLFGVMGIKFENNGKVWKMTCLNRDDIYESCEVEPSSAKEIVESVIRYDEEHGNKSNIDYIGINSRIAVALFLEGHLTVEHFKRAQCGHGHVILQDIPFADGYYALIIRDERTVPYQVVTLTKQGEVV